MTVRDLMKLYIDIKDQIKDVEGDPENYDEEEYLLIEKQLYINSLKERLKELSEEIGASLYLLDEFYNLYRTGEMTK